MTRGVVPADGACDFGGSEGVWEAKGEVSSPRFPRKEHTDLGSSEIVLRTEHRNHGLRRHPGTVAGRVTAHVELLALLGTGGPELQCPSTVKPGICRVWKRPHFQLDEENATLWEPLGRWEGSREGERQVPSVPRAPSERWRRGSWLAVTSDRREYRLRRGVGISLTADSSCCPRAHAAASHRPFGSCG